MTDCEPNPDGEDEDINASLFCTADSGQLVAAYSYPDTASLTNDIETRKLMVDEASSGECENGEDEVFTWYYEEGVTEGTAICYNFGENFTIFWSYDDELLSFMALDQDATALYEWWTHFDPIPQ